MFSWLQLFLSVRRWWNNLVSAVKSGAKINWSQKVLDLCAFAHRAMDNWGLTSNPTQPKMPKLPEPKPEPKEPTSEHDAPQEPKEEYKMW